MPQFFVEVKPSSAPACFSQALLSSATKAFPFDSLSRFSNGQSSLFIRYKAAMFLTKKNIRKIFKDCPCQIIWMFVFIEYS